MDNIVNIGIIICSKLSKKKSCKIGHTIISQPDLRLKWDSSVVNKNVYNFKDTDSVELQPFLFLNTFLRIFFHLINFESMIVLRV